MNAEGKLINTEQFTAMQFEPRKYQVFRLNIPGQDQSAADGVLSLEELVSEAKGMFETMRNLVLNDLEFAVIYYTDEVIVKELEQVQNFKLEHPDKLLELRLFGEKSEIYLIRAEDSKKNHFVGRILIDLDEESVSEQIESESLDEYHEIYPRVAQKINVNRTEFTGKEYSVFVKVRNYFNCKDELKLNDWRFVGFEALPKNECE